MLREKQPVIHKCDVTPKMHKNGQGKKTLDDSKRKLRAKKKMRKIGVAAFICI